MRDLLRMMRVCLVLVLWPLSALAAADSLGATMGAIELRDWASVLVLAGVSGAVALLHRIRRSFEAAAIAAASGAPVDLDAHVLIDWRLFVGSQMAAALFAGLIAFFLGEAAGMNNFLEAAGIALASWSGAKAVDLWAEGFRGRVAAFMAGGNGNGNGNNRGG